MPTYLYRCPADGSFEARLPMAAAGAMSDCPVCGAPAPRRFTPPLLSRTPAPVAAARLREEASRDAPVVTTTLPEAPRRPAPPRNPRWRALPRP
ncbi:FmdB family zinc ribbon protein [Blastococcus sp. SYSU D01042]